MFLECRNRPVREGKQRAVQEQGSWELHVVAGQDHGNDQALAMESGTWPSPCSNISPQVPLSQWGTWQGRPTGNTAQAGTENKSPGYKQLPQQVGLSPLLRLQQLRVFQLTKPLALGVFFFSLCKQKRSHCSSAFTLSRGPKKMPTGLLCEEQTMREDQLLPSAPEALLRHHPGTWWSSLRVHTMLMLLATTRQAKWC